MAIDISPYNPDIASDNMPITLEMLAKLKKDLRETVLDFSPSEVRYLVDFYYSMQKFRISTHNAVVAMGKADEANTLIAFIEEQVEIIETNIKSALDYYTKQVPIGQWIRLTKGIGPVISAGMLAHYDIEKAPTVGHFYSFSGHNPKAVWAKGEKRPWNAKLKVICVHPMSRVNTRRGLMPIKKVQVGDEVLTHLGRWRKVTQLFVNKFEGNMVGVKIRGNGRQTAWITPNHPVYAMRPGKMLEREYVHGREEKIANETQVAEMRAMREEGHTLRAIGEKFNYTESGVWQIVNNQRRNGVSMPDETGWARADAIIGGSWQGFIPKRPIENMLFTLCMSQEGMIKYKKEEIIAQGQWKGVPAPRANPIPKTIDVTPQVARLIGLFLAEGHSYRNTIGFSFHIDEIEYHEFVRSQMRELFGLEPYATVDKSHLNTLQIIYGNKSVANTFRHLFGKGAKNKKIPNKLMRASRPVLTQLLRGMFEGDAFVTVSRKLGYQILDLTRMLGIACCMRVEHPLNKATVYRIDVQDKTALYSVLFGEDYEDERDPSRVFLKKQTEEGYWYFFRELEQMPYKGKVYNLEVEEDESYTVEGMAVHNCWRMGESFVKVSGIKDASYGKLYAFRKQLEILRNERGDYKEAAAKALTDKNYNRETQTKETYLSGKLPAAQLHLRATRWAIQIFLSHLHTVWYWQHFNKNGGEEVYPPRPYVFEFLGHQHFMMPENLDMFPKLEKHLRHRFPHAQNIDEWLQRSHGKLAQGVY